MKGVNRYDENYNPGPYAAPGTYSAENFRENLAALLRLKNLTQARAAELCGVDPPHVSMWITGEQKPSLITFARICEALEIEPNWLLAKHKPIRKARTTDEDKEAITT